jgi:NifU-like protein
MAVYPQKIADLIDTMADVEPRGKSVSGRSASFECGCFVEIELSFDGNICIDGRLRTNGCGYVIATSQVLISSLRGVDTKALKGFDGDEIISKIESQIGRLDDRRSCAEICIAALHRAFEAHRADLVAEYAGESALICTCFGVDEAAIIASINENGIPTIDKVSASLMAGRGCGSCRGLIEEIIDTVR